MECVFFLFPGRVFVVLLCVTGIRTDKEPTGQSPLSILEPRALYWISFLGVNTFFKLFLEGRVGLSARKMEGRVPRDRAGCGGMRRLLGVAGAPPSKKHGNRGADCCLR